MEQHFRKKNRKLDPSVGDDVTLQVIEWFDGDSDSESSDSRSDDESSDSRPEGPGKYTITAFGVTSSNVSCTVKITDFNPYYYVKVPDTFTKRDASNFLNFIQDAWQLKKKVNDVWEPFYGESLVRSECKIVKRKDIYGFTNGKLQTFLKVVFSSKTAMNKSKYIFKNSVSIAKRPFVKYTLYESNLEPLLRFCHTNDIKTAGWITVSRFKLTDSKTQISVQAHYKDVLPVKKTEIADFLQLSWDIETYSFDGNFPDPCKKNKFCKTTNEMDLFPNVIYQIGCTFKYYGSGKLVKCLLTLKDCDPIDDAVVICCENEKDLLIKFALLVESMDPDVMYTYNGDTFDCRYVFERARIYGLVNSDGRSGFLFETLSRNGTPARIKKDLFSSSAYGDSEFMRFYIPGRLNYDLLIHYKRGNKKYASYKLDNIAKEILNESKHDITPKQIFEYYRQGESCKINAIGRYCIQDTELLQRLVDKQRILVTIIQLASVTFVPISYLVTRGQTIKVYSQLLRKATQKNFLVPDTNFNQNNFPVLLCSAKPVDVSEGDFIEIDIFDEYKRVEGTITEVVSDTQFLANVPVDLPCCKYKKFRIKNSRVQGVLDIRPGEDATDTTFTGATVLEAESGLYPGNIAVLDFASLYPTIMISRNLCYSTFVMDETYNNIPGVNYERMKWEDKIEYKLKHNCEALVKTGKSAGKPCGKQAYFVTKETSYVCRIHDPEKKTRPSSEKYQKKDVSFDFTIVQRGSGDNIGVVPALLEELYNERKAVKKEMAQTTDPEIRDILDSTQLAIKIALNSTYGYLGRKQGNLVLKELGSIVTAVGRSLIEQSKSYIEQEFPKEEILSSLVCEMGLTDVSRLSSSEKRVILEQFSV